MMKAPSGDEGLAVRRPSSADRMLPGGRCSRFRPFTATDALVGVHPSLFGAIRRRCRVGALISTCSVLDQLAGPAGSSGELFAHVPSVGGAARVLAPDRQASCEGFSDSSGADLNGWPAICTRPARGRHAPARSLALRRELASRSSRRRARPPSTRKRASQPAITSRARASASCAARASVALSAMSRSSA